MSVEGVRGDVELLRARGPGILANREASELAEYLGYTRRAKDTPFNTHGRPAFTNGRNYITPDIDSHNGGVWKMFNRRGDLLGTFDAMLNQIK
jgi:filamentous hemagglutinin